MRALKGNSGFSLIELVVALTILSILVAIAVPSFLEFLRMQKASSSANSALVMMQFARSEAIKRQANIEVNIIDTSADWTVEVRLDSTNELLRTLKQDDTQTTWSGNNTLVFDLRGRPVAASCMQLDISGSSGLTRSINILSGGKIAVKEGACS